MISVLFGALALLLGYGKGIWSAVIPKRSFGVDGTTWSHFRQEGRENEKNEHMYLLLLVILYCPLVHGIDM